MFWIDQRSVAVLRCTLFFSSSIGREEDHVPYAYLLGRLGRYPTVMENRCWNGFHTRVRRADLRIARLGLKPPLGHGIGDAEKLRLYTLNSRGQSQAVQQKPCMWLNQNPYEQGGLAVSPFSNKIFHQDVIRFAIGASTDIMTLEDCDEGEIARCRTQNQNQVTNTWFKAMATLS